MLTFTEESDFFKVDIFQENEDGSVSWVWDEGENLTTHSGIIFEGLVRTIKVQDGVEDVVVGQEPVTDDQGNPTYYDDTGTPILRDITVSQPKMVDVEVDVWAKLWELHNDNSSTVTVQPVGVASLKEKAKQLVNSQRDSLIHGGVSHNGYTFQTDVTSITDLMGAIVAGIDTKWLTADNIQVDMTASDLQALGQAVARHKEVLVYKAREHKNNIESLSTKVEIDDYVANLSWED